MDIDKTTINETIIKNIRLRLKRSQLEDDDLADVACIGKEEAAIVLATGGANGFVLYKIASALNCAVDDLFIGIYDERNADRSGGNVNGDRLQAIHTLQKHELIKQLGAISNQELRDSLYQLISGFAGIFRFMDMEGLSMQKVAG